MKNVRLYVLDGGFFSGGNISSYFNLKKEELSETRTAVPCFLIVHPNGTLIWDVGALPDDDFKDGGSPFSMSWAPESLNVRLNLTKTLQSQLREIGFQSSDITYLAHSHLHGDHTANSNQFAESIWLVRQVEYDIMFSDKPPLFCDQKHYEKLKYSKKVFITTNEFDVFGDGKVIIRYAPGHTPGHQLLVLKLANTGNVMLSGDLYHFPEERKLNRLPIIEFNKEQSFASRAFVEDYCKKTNTDLWIQHDFTANAKLKKLPLFYD